MATRNSIEYEFQAQERAVWSLYNKNTEAEYGVLHGYLCVQVVGRCKSDQIYGIIHRNTSIVVLS